MYYCIGNWGPSPLQEKDGISKLIEHYEAGYERYLHCPCHICDLRRQENNKELCVKGSCEGCRNLASGKKIRNWNDDLYAGIK